MIGTISTTPRSDTVDVLGELLAEIDTATDVDEFYDRVCEGVCRLTTMERVGLFLYDRTLRSVRAVGSHGVDSTLLEGVEGTLEETPIAQQALSTDEVVEASEDLEHEVPLRYARFAGITTLTCIPVSAGGRWFGVIFADRGGGRFTLTSGERQTMWTLGKLAALAASVEQATIQREAARRLSDRISLIREIHERVIQRLFGLLLAMGSDEALTDEGRAVCHDELRQVLQELRSSLGGSFARGAAARACARSSIASPSEPRSTLPGPRASRSRMSSSGWPRPCCWRRFETSRSTPTPRRSRSRSMPAAEHSCSRS